MKMVLKKLSKLYLLPRQVGLRLDKNNEDAISTSRLCPMMTPCDVTLALAASNIFSAVAPRDIF